MSLLQEVGLVRWCDLALIAQFCGGCGLFDRKVALLVLELVSLKEVSMNQRDDPRV